MPKKQWTARLYLGRDAEGKQLFKWIGRFDRKGERDKALAEARLEHERGGSIELPTCDAYVKRYLADYERRNKDSSLHTVTQHLQRFKKDFAGRSLDVSREEAKDWVHGEGRWERDKPIPPGYVQAVISLYDYGLDEDDLPLERNPFRKLYKPYSGRAKQPPPSEQEFAALLRSAERLGDYGKTVKAMLQFSAYSLMRPGEIFALEWSDIDFEEMRIGKNRRLFRGRLDEPKTGRKTIALTPPARDAIIGLPRVSNYVFLSKTGKRFSQSMLSTYWANVLSGAGLDFDFYHAAKHYGVWYMWTKLKMSPRAIAAQAGWKLSTVVQLLEVYGHGDVGALEEVDEAFAKGPKPELRVVEGGRDG
jgi:integrase